MHIVLILSLIKTAFLSDFWLGISQLKNIKHLKKISEELMPIARHPK